MSVKLINNTFATLHEGITETTDVLWLDAGQGAQFGTLAANEYFYITMPLLDNGREVDWEVMKVTAVNADFLTVERGQDGTPARSWPVGSRLEARINKAVFRDLEVETNARIAVKSDTTYVDTELAKKSDTTYVDTELAKKSDTTYVDSELAEKIDLVAIVDDLTSTLADAPLSANQGRVLKELIDSINALLQSDDSNLDELQEIVDFIKLNRADLDSLSIASISGLQTALDGKVDKITGKQLSTEDFTTALLTKLNGIAAGAQVNVATNLSVSGTGDSRTIASSTGTNATFSFSLADLGAAASSHTHAWSQVTGAPTTATRWPTWGEVTSKPSTFAPAAHNHSGDDITSGTVADARLPSTAVRTSRSISTGNGLSGGGNLSANRTFSLTNIAAGSSSRGAVYYNGTSRSAGRFYGGTTNPSHTTRLNYSGNFHANNFIEPSDIRLKEEIEVIKGGLEKVKKLSGYTYTMKESGERKTGVIAQEVLEVLPEAIDGSDQDGYSVAYGNMIGLLIEAVKDLSVKIENIEEKLK